MKSHLKLLLTPLLFFCAVSFGTTPVSAAENDSCYAIYGGGASCIQSENLGVDLAIQDPHFSRYVDNLGPTESKYTPGQIILFKITVKNTDTKNALNKIAVTYTFPQYVIAQNDPKKRTSSWTIDTLAKGEERVVYIQGLLAKTVPQNTCVIAQVAATSGESISRDNSRFCLDQKAVLGVVAKPRSNPPATKGGLPVYPPTQSKKTPDTGPEAVALLALLPAGALGMWLRRKSESRTP